MFRTRIKTNGTYKLKGNHRETSSVIYVSGPFGTATAKLVTSNGDGTFSPLEDGAVTATDTQYLVEHGSGMDVYVEILTADATTDITFANAGMN